jgi:hypothetical protein
MKNALYILFVFARFFHQQLQQEDLFGSETEQKLTPGLGVIMFKRSLLVHFKFPDVAGAHRCVITLLYGLLLPQPQATSLPV